jgi:hypothetical protein
MFVIWPFQTKQSANWRNFKDRLSVSRWLATYSADLLLPHNRIIT